jgi:hypothetical protein
MDAERLKEELERQVAQYLATGECDPLGCAFPGCDVLERLAGFDRHLRTALLEEVLRREHGRRQTQVPPVSNPTAWTRRKIRPMVTRLFPANEREIVLRMAERSIVLLTREATRRSHSGNRGEHDELIDILGEAIGARNGWKRILARCSNPRRLQSVAQSRQDSSSARR